GCLRRPRRLRSGADRRRGELWRAAALPERHPRGLRQRRRRRARRPSHRRASGPRTSTRCMKEKIERMSDADLCYTPATELAAMIRAKKLSPVELTRAVLARIE